MLGKPNGPAKRQEKSGTKERKGKERKGREGKGREGKGRAGQGREGKGREGTARQGKARQGKERKGKERKGKVGDQEQQLGKPRIWYSKDQHPRSPMVYLTGPSPPLCGNYCSLCCLFETWG